MAHFQDETKSDPSAEEREGARRSNEPRTRGQSRGRLVLLGLLVLVAVVLLVTLVDRERTLERALDDDLCPLGDDEIAGSAALVVDLAKPVGDTSFVSGLMGEVSRNLRMDEELRVYAITASDTAGGLAANSPTLIGRVCKPYNNADLLFGPAKDQRGAWRDCHDLPAQLPPTLRDLAGRFCAARDDLQTAINTLTAGQGRAGAIASAELATALGNVRTALSARPAPRKLYVFSDMLQHAAWYSHFDLDWTQWSATEYLGALAGSTASDLDVSIFYLPRQRLTGALRLRNAHKQFWRSFFQGADVQFEDLPAVPAYAVQRLMPLEESGEDGTRDEVDRLLEETELLRGRVAEARDRLADLREQSLSDNAEDGGTDETAPAEPQTAANEPPQPAAATIPSADESDAGTPEDAPPAVAALPNPAPAAEETQPESVPAPEAAPAPAPAEAAPTTASESALAASEPAPTTPEPASTTPEPVPATAEPAPAAPPPALQSAIAEVPPAEMPCEVQIKPRFLAEQYPNDRRVNYGDGTVVVDFLLDESGATIDAEVVWRREESSSNRPRSLDALGADTLAAVRAWEVDFSSPSACAQPQRRRATFTYRSKCVGAPSPSCRTVREDVDILTLDGNP